MPLLRHDGRQRLLAIVRTQTNTAPMGMKARARKAPQPKVVPTFGFPFRFYGADPHEYNDGNAVYDIWFVKAPVRASVESLLPAKWQWNDAFAHVELGQTPDDALLARMRTVFREMHAVAAIDQVWFLAATEDESEWSFWSFDEGPPRQAAELAADIVTEEPVPIEQLVAEARENLEKEFYGTSYWPDMFAALVPHRDRADVQAVLAEGIFEGWFWKQLPASPLTSEWLWSLVDDTAEGVDLHGLLKTRGYEPAMRPPTVAEALAKVPRLMGTGARAWMWSELREAMAASADQPEVGRVLQDCIVRGYMHYELFESQLSSEFLASVEAGEETQVYLDTILIKRGYEPAIEAALSTGKYLNTLIESGEERAVDLATKEMTDCVEHWHISGERLAGYLIKRVADNLSAEATFDVAQLWLHSGKSLASLFRTIAKGKTPDSRWLPVALEHPDMGDALAAVCPHPDRPALLRKHTLARTPLTWPLLEALLDDEATVDRHIAYRPDDDIEKWMYVVCRLAGQVELTDARVTALVAVAEFAIARVDHLAEINSVGKLLTALLGKRDVDWKALLQARSAFYGEKVAPGNRVLPWEGREFRDLSRGLNRLAKATKSLASMAKWWDSL